MSPGCLWGGKVSSLVWQTAYFLGSCLWRLESTFFWLLHCLVCVDCARNEFQPLGLKNSLNPWLVALPPLSTSDSVEGRRNPVFCKWKIRVAILWMPLLGWSLDQLKRQPFSGLHLSTGFLMISPGAMWLTKCHSGRTVPTLATFCCWVKGKGYQLWVTVSSWVRL